MYLVDELLPRRLFLMPRPRGGPALADEIDAWHAARVDLVVSLLTPDETGQLGLADEAAACARQWIEFTSFPIGDHDVPASMPAIARLARRLAAALDDDRGVAIHCRAGIGRSATLAACVLHELGIPFDRILPMLSKARGLSVPDTLQQIDWIRGYCAQPRGGAAPLRAVR